MIRLYLNEVIREELLNYDIEHSEHCYDRDMFYIINSEEIILMNILENINTDVLIKMGFDDETIQVIQECDFEVRFTNRNKCYLKGHEDIDWIRLSEIENKNGKTKEDYQEEEFLFNEYHTDNYHTIIDNYLLGHKIGNEICNNLNKEIVRDDGEYDIGIICEMIDEECLNEARINIQNHIIEYLNNYLE